MPLASRLVRCCFRHSPLRVPWRWLGLSLGLLLELTACSTSQAVRPELLARIRRGAEQVNFGQATVRVPLVGTSTLPLVSVLVNGKGPFRFLFDAGGNVVTVKNSVVRAVGGRVLQKRGKTDVVGIDSLQVGAVVFRNVTAGALEELDVDGVLGFNLFREGLLTLDYPAQQLTWALGGLPAPDGRQVFAYQLRDRMPYLPVRLGQDTTWFNFDTGAAQWFYLPKALAPRLPLASPPQAGPASWNQQAGTQRNETARLRIDLSIGPYRVLTPYFLFTQDTEALLGSGFLQHFVVTFDLSRQRVRLARPDTVPLAMPEVRRAGMK
ncbi:retroviral-like aspartic protease family protein [Hymenobacter sp. BT175]|uniref:retropepsin-like aspartic protease n=1 Tax=Hymenobacter translucens TaxID=2886507 RepID=UPI001D0E2D4A|nr:retropepsin-like aspartic protease [Hymenobacter translucens]MCC2545495.1 retroviral-like aspartic protease family protein [Hymenobacter translucens]